MLTSSHNLLYSLLQSSQCHCLSVVQLTPHHRIASVILLNTFRLCHTSAPNCSLFHHRKSNSKKKKKKVKLHTLVHISSCDMTFYHLSHLPSPPQKTPDPGFPTGYSLCLGHPCPSSHIANFLIFFDFVQ